MIDVSDVVFSRCKVALEEYFGDDNITVGASKAQIPENYPAALIVQIGAVATDSSFTNTQHAVVSTLEVHSYAEDAQVSKRIIAIIADTLNIMNYALIFGFEDISTDIDVTHYIARFRRTIGAGDAIKIF